LIDLKPGCKSTEFTQSKKGIFARIVRFKWWQILARDEVFEARRTEREYDVARIIFRMLETKQEFNYEMLIESQKKI